MTAPLAMTAPVVRVAALLGCSIALAFAAHAESPTAAPPIAPLDIHGLWRVDQARTEPLLDRGRARLDFATDGVLIGNTSCSAMSARYQLDGARIQIGTVTTAPAATGARCGRLQLEQEDRILTALELAVTAKVRDDGLLELRDAEGRGLLRGTRFGPDSDDATP